MYIPLWIIILGIICYIYYSSKKKKNNDLSTKNVDGVFKHEFSYKLEISIEPGWHKIYKKLIKPKSEEEWQKVLDRKFKDSDELDDEDLWGRRYYFTEFYDSISGLTTHFQKTIIKNQNIFTTVEEFGDRGYILSLDHKYDSKESDEAREGREKLAVDIGENFIRNNIYDPYIGGPKSNFDYKKEDYLFYFPLQEVLNFLFALGQRFHGAEENTIVKWPDHIEQKFKEHSIRYETQFEFEPSLLNIEGTDEEFFKQNGQPKVSSSSNDRFHSTYLTTEDGTYYRIKLKIFRPGENGRINPL